MLAKQVDERTIPIPPDLRNYLTVTSQPHENFLTLQHSRERRLHLLLRRYTNQIQYGCKNPHCDTPTCLSYRRRYSPVPVRPYSEIAARTLAWQYVEEYTGNDSLSYSDAYTGSATRRRSKSKVCSTERPRDLCWNEPVIPWYEDPMEFLRKKRPSQERPRRAAQVLSEKGQSESPNRTSLSSSSRRMQNGGLETESKEDRRTAYHRNQKMQNEKSQPSPEDENEFTPGDAPHSNMLPIQQNMKFESTTAESEHVVEQPKDTASFSQSLYDTIAIKSLDQFSATDSLHNIRIYSDNICQEHNRESNPKTIAYSLDAAKQSIPPQASTYTFKILNKRVMSWLLSLVASNSSHQVVLSDSPKVSMSVTDLAQQSLHYCLSHPLRLMESVGQWGTGTISGTSTSETVDQGHQNCSPITVPILGNGDRRSIKCRTYCIPSLRDANRAFEVLSCIQPHPMILDSILIALQYSYKPPPYLSTVRLRSFSALFEEFHAQSMQNTTSSTSKLDHQPPNHLDYLSDQQVASLCMICILSIIHHKGRANQVLEFPLHESTSASTYFNYVWCNELGQTFPNAYLYWTFDRAKDPEWKTKYSAVLGRIDANEDLHLIRILDSFGNIISYRLALHKTSRTIKGLTTDSETSGGIVELLVNHIHNLDQAGIHATNQTTLSLLDLLRVILLKKWDRRPVIRRASSVGGALQMMAGLYKHRLKLGMPENAFIIKFVAEAFDAVKMPLEWLSFRENSKDLHIFSYSFLFEPAYLVKYFRAINIETMRRSHEYASIVHSIARPFFIGPESRPDIRPEIPVYGTAEVLAELRPHMARYFVLTVRRDNMLEDAIDQIWRRQRQELMRPLKVHLGKDEGEGGLDHGGVQQEFFRLVLAAALDPSHGMFTVDESTRMTWFQPGSFEPLYKFEAIGTLMSLAVYNAVTLPVTFPLAFYRKLLGLKVKHLEHIEDGWPDLARGLKSLQDWEDGDVGDVMARTYEFSYRMFDKNVSVDMSRIGRQTTWPPSQRYRAKQKPKTTTFESLNLESVISPEDSSSSIPETSAQQAKGSRSSNAAKREIRIQVHTPSITPESNLTSPLSSNTTEEAPLVTNANRKQYIRDYVFWLTNKSIAPQFEAFSKGFYSCLETTALSIFTAEALKTVVEGHTEIDIEGLQATTVYEEFSATDQIIVDFWDIVKTSMNSEQHKQLLEFVTASERVPVNGISTVTFIIQKNGDDDERLPSSSTCYGRLLLPAYSSKKILKKKLEKAIENSVGFGSL